MFSKNKERLVALMTTTTTVTGPSTIQDKVQLGVVVAMGVQYSSFNCFFGSIFVCSYPWALRQNFKAKAHMGEDL